MMSASTLVTGCAFAAPALVLGWGLRSFWNGRTRPERRRTALEEQERRELAVLRRSHALLQQRWQQTHAWARETERELVSLAYSVSHDLRAPLRAMDGFSQALTEDYGHRLDATAHDYLRRVRANAVHMSVLIDDLLALARVVRAPFRPETVDVSGIARELARELTIGEPTRPVRWEIPPNVVAVADRALLAETLRQLLGNAWKFTAPRDVAQISLCVLPPDPEHPAGIVYQVRDNGVGFDMQYAGRLFGAFQRMHSAEEFPAGRGIGLATVQRIVHRHGGQVWAEASPEHGARFSFTLEGAPLEPASDRFPAVAGLGKLSAESAAADALLPKTTNV